MLDNGDCKVEPAKSPSGGPVDPRRPVGPISITASVGQGGFNKPDDVFKIQYALDTVAPIDGGADPRLKLDSMCGPLTIKAIRDFQQKQFGWSGTDGRIDPGKQTLKRLNELKNDNVFPTLPLSFTTDDWLFVAMMQHIPHTKSCMEAARTNVQLAMNSVDSSSGLIGPSRDERMSLLNRHFRIDSLPSPRIASLQKIYDIYGNMQQVLNKPDNFFTLDTDDSGEKISTVAFAPLGGFFDKNDLSGRIVFRRGVFFATGIPDFAAFVFIHELRHFVDREQQNGHFGKGWVTDPAMQALKTRDLLNNCDTYAGFALEAKNGIMDRPGWVRSSVFR
jgi:hypothetical protein